MGGSGLRLGKLKTGDREFLSNELFSGVSWLIASQVNLMAG